MKDADGHLEESGTKLLTLRLDGAYTKSWGSYLYVFIGLTANCPGLKGELWSEMSCLLDPCMGTWPQENDVSWVFRMYLAHGINCLTQET